MRRHSVGGAVGYAAAVLRAALGLRGLSRGFPAGKQAGGGEGEVCPCCITIHACMYVQSFVCSGVGMLMCSLSRMKLVGWVQDARVPACAPPPGGPLQEGALSCASCTAMHTRPWQG